MSISEQTAALHKATEDRTRAQAEQIARLQPLLNAAAKQILVTGESLARDLGSAVGTHSYAYDSDSPHGVLACRFSNNGVVVSLQYFDAEPVKTVKVSGQIVDGEFCYDRGNPFVALRIPQEPHRGAPVVDRRTAVVSELGKTVVTYIAQHGNQPEYFSRGIVICSKFSKPKKSDSKRTQQRKLMELPAD